MITAMQAARIKAISELVLAREHVLHTVSLVCWANGEAADLHAVISKIDRVLGRLVPNAPTPPGGQDGN